MSRTPFLIGRGECKGVCQCVRECVSVSSCVYCSVWLCVLWEDNRVNGSVLEQLVWMGENCSVCVRDWSECVFLVSIDLNVDQWLTQPLVCFRYVCEFWFWKWFWDFHVVHNYCLALFSNREMHYSYFHLNVGFFYSFFFLSFFLSTVSRSCELFWVWSLKD